MSPIRTVWSSAAVLAPWVAVAIVLAVTAGVNHTLDLGALSFNMNVPGGTLNPASTDLLRVSNHLLARVAWGVPAIGFGLVAIVAAATALFVIANCFREVPGAERGKYLGVIAVAALCLLILALWLGDRIMTEPEFTTNLRKATLHRTFATHAVSVDSFFDSVSQGVFLSLLVAASAALVVSRNAVHNITQVCARIKYVHWLLYFGAAALVLRDIEMYMLYRWPQIWFAKEQADAIDHVALALSVAHGAFFSAVLMALYLPTAFILRMRSKAVAIQAVAGTNEQPESWLEKSGFNVSPFKELANVFATITPLLAGGTVAKLVGVLAA